MTLLLLLLLLLVQPLRAQTVTWTPNDPSPNPEAQTVGYQVYVGAESRVYTLTLDVGDTDRTTLPPLADPHYYVAVGAYNADRTLGDLSYETEVTAVPQVTPCTYDLLDPMTVIGNAGGTGSLHVQASRADCPWAATSHALWLALTQASGTGSGTFSFTASPNTTEQPRTATITLEGDTLALSQSPGAPPPICDAKTQPLISLGSFTNRVTIGETGRAEVSVQSPAGRRILKVYTELGTESWTMEITSGASYLGGLLYLPTVRGSNLLLAWAMDETGCAARTASARTVTVR